MGLLKFLFGDKTKIDREFDVPTLGKLIWDEDEESWVGSSNNMEVLLSFECGQPRPTQEVVSYALYTLSNLGQFELTLEREKEIYKSQYKSHHKEVDLLKYSSFHFYIDKTKCNRIIASLESSQNERAWRIEFLDNECQGIGFDS